MSRDRTQKVSMKKFERMLLVIMFSLLAVNIFVGRMNLKEASALNQSIIDPVSITSEIQ